MSRPTPPAYKTRNWPAYNEALKRRGSLTIWFDPAMTWDAAPTGKRGRQPDYGDAAIQTCLTMKVLFGMALRQTTGFVESLLRLIGLDWAVPDFSTLSRRQKTLKVNIPYRGSDGPLHLLVDGTGIKVEGEGEWNARKHGGSKRVRHCPRTMYGWRPRGKGVSVMLASGRLRPCIRRRSCSTLAARPDESPRSLWSQSMARAGVRSGPNRVSIAIMSAILPSSHDALAVLSGASAPVSFRRLAPADIPFHFSEAHGPFGPCGWPARWPPVSACCAG